MADLLEITCTCGYRAEIAEGGLFAGVMALFVCDDCHDVIGVLTWSSGSRTDTPFGPVEPRCGRCNGSNLRPWRHEDESEGTCPRCQQSVAVASIGIAD